MKHTLGRVSDHNFLSAMPVSKDIDEKYGSDVMGTMSGGYKRDEKSPSSYEPTGDAHGASLGQEEAQSLTEAEKWLTAKQRKQKKGGEWHILAMGENECVEMARAGAETKQAEMETAHAWRGSSLSRREVVSR